jgi:hypothetical protein
VGDKVFERVSSFKYLSNVVNKEGRMSECVKDRIQAGNRVYAANYHMLQSKIIKRPVKMQIHKTLIRPDVTYGSETWTLTKSDENLLRIFERKILRQSYGPIQEGHTWRIRNNEELNRSINGEDIVKFTKAQRIRWLGQKENGSGSNAEKDDGRKTVHRKKKKTSFQMHGRCGGRSGNNEDKAVDGEDRRQRAMESGC